MVIHYGFGYLSFNKKDNKYWGKWPQYQFGKPKSPRRVLGDPNEFDLKYYYTSKGRRMHMTGDMIDEELQRRYVTQVYAQTGKYEETGRRLGIDRRTVKKYLDAELLAELRED